MIALAVQRGATMNIRDQIAGGLVAVLLFVAAASATAEDWPQFRGPGGRGIGATEVPLEWDDTTHVRWKTPLPGPGSSSPIVHGDAIFVTCWSEGASGQGPTRHLVKIGRKDGKVAWQRDIAAPGTALSRVSIAIQWIRENFTRPLRVETLAAMAALSVSAFHRHFKAVTALSPLQYQKRIRLLHARSLLIAGEGNATSVAFGVGYESPTQFSREYSRYFGLPPSKDSLQTSERSIRR
jgi:AraC-like DNA-binding protein